MNPREDIECTPRIVFNGLEERKEKTRFMVATEGSWRPVTWDEYSTAVRQVALYLVSEQLKTGDRVAIFSPNRWEWIASALGIESAGGVMVPIYPSNNADQAAYIVDHSDAQVVFVDTAPVLERVFQRWDAYAAVKRIVVLDDKLNPAEVVKNMAGEGARNERSERGRPAVPSFAEIERKVISWSCATTTGKAINDEDAERFPRLLDELSLDQTSIMLYTSGTTGNPKGVPLTYRNVMTNTRDWMRNNWALLESAKDECKRSAQRPTGAKMGGRALPVRDPRSGGVDLLWLPMSHIFGYGESYIGDMLGWTSYLTDPTQVVDLMPEVRPSVFMSVPSYWEKLAVSAMNETDESKKKERLLTSTGGRLQFCLSGGAGLKREVKELFHASGMLIIEGYGLTETSPTLTLNRPDDFRFDAVGKSLESVQLKLAEDGEILAKGPNVFGGYHKDEASTKESFTEDGWFKTGDVGRFTSDGFLQIVDRKKDILVTAGGKNVAPANIELRFRDDPFIEHVVVYGDEKKYLVAGVWLNHDAVKTALAEATKDVDEATERDLVQARIDIVNSQLARYETIKRFGVMQEPLTLDNGMLTPTLKIRRKRIYERHRHSFEDLYA